MLCESCQQREATCHVTTIAGDVMHKRDLCPACFATTFPDNFPEGTPQSPSFSADARCEYCGRQPCITGGDILATATGSQSSKSMCTECFFEHSRYVQQHLPRDAGKLSHQQQLATVEELKRNTERHMREWGSKRRSPEDQP